MIENERNNRCHSRSSLRTLLPPTEVLKALWQFTSIWKPARIPRAPLSPPQSLLSSQYWNLRWNAVFWKGYSLCLFVNMLRCGNSWTKMCLLYIEISLCTYFLELFCPSSYRDRVFCIRSLLVLRMSTLRQTWKLFRFVESSHFF